MSLVSELKTIADYNPTAYVNNSEPDLDAEHLNKTEQALKRVTDAANDAINALKELEKQKLSLNAIVQTESTATDKVPSSAYFKQVIDNINSNLSHKANAADYALINLAGMNFLYDQNNNTVGFQWLFGANKEYGYAINISTANGGMQFYYLNNGTWMPSWNK